MLLHDNAKSHVAKVVRRKREQLNWEVLPYPPYSPDLAPTDLSPIRSLSNYLKEKKLDNLNQLENALNTFFFNKSLEFYASGIDQLPRRWITIVDSEGEYIHN